jgi:hypothetical protein
VLVTAQVVADSLGAAQVVADSLGAVAPPPELPGGALPSLSQLFVGGAPDLAILLALLGDFLWLVAYVLFIRAGFKDRTYGVPFLAICLNFTWEFWFAIVRPPAQASVHWLHVGWFLLDVVIVWQLLRYGRKEQTIPEIARWFYPVVVATMVLALAGQVTLHEQLNRNALFPDTDATGAAWSINLVMSVLFVFLYFGRRDLHGLSYAGAWAITIGSAMVAIANVILFARKPHVNFEIQTRRVGTEEWLSAGTVGTDTLDLRFFYFLFVTILLFNLLYVLFLHRARKRRAIAAGAAAA